MNFMDTYRRAHRFFADPANAAALLFAFILVFMKKWEPGGNIDTIWYEAIAKNIATSGDFFHFYISKNYGPVHDHMPLTYWIVGGIMRIFGVSDFVARLYPMACSYASCLLVYASARSMRGSQYGLCCLIAYALCLGAMKWNGSLMQDVPLTTCFIGCFWSILRARQNPRWLVVAGICFGLAVLTKGPIIFGVAGAFVIWMFWERCFDILASRWTLVAAASVAVILGSLFLPSLLFDGRPYYELFYEAKKGYVAPATGGWIRYFAYAEVLWTGAFLMIPFAISALVRLVDEPFKAARSALRLAFLIIVCTVLPLSIFEVKFPHYMLPVYPFIALLAGATLERMLPVAWLARLPDVMRWSAIATALFFVAMPLKITGQRNKAVLNMVNAVKLDTGIKTKDVAFIGEYGDEMSVLQSFKLYGSIDLAMHDSKWASEADLNKAWLIIPISKLPLARAAGASIDRKDCLFEVDPLCAVTAREGLAFRLPEDRYPHEIY